MFGYEKAELMSGNIGTLSSGVHLYTAEGALQRAERARLGTLPPFEWQCKTKNGVFFWVEVLIRYVEFDRIPAIVAVVRDITERKRGGHSDYLYGPAQRPRGSGRYPQQHRRCGCLHGQHGKHQLPQSCRQRNDGMVAARSGRPPSTSAASCRRPAIG